MISGKVIDNKVYCKICETEIDGHILDYGLYESNGEAYTYFIKKCGGCGQKTQYLVDNDIDKSTRYEVPKNNKPVKGKVVQPTEQKEEVIEEVVSRRIKKMERNRKIKSSIQYKKKKLLI